MNHIFPGILLNHLKNIVKISQTRPQSSQKGQKWIKICKIHDVDKKYTAVRLSIAFFCSILEPNTENIKKYFGTKLF